MDETFKHILVTGGAGFVGSHLIRELTERYPNARIASIDIYSTGKVENHLDHPNVAYHRMNTADICKFEDFTPDILFHLGEYSRIAKSFDDIALCNASNMGGTFAVLQYCREKSCKLVYAASSSKFGNNGEDQHLSPYAWMKAKNVELIENFDRWFGLDYAITYFYNVYGPGQIMTGDYATVIGIFQQQVLEGREITVVSPGSQKRDFTHVQDIVRGVIAAAEKGRGDGYLLGTGSNYSIEEIAEAFDHPWVLVPERKGERFTSQAYPTKADEELGWKAQHNVIEYIKSWKASLAA